ncbi:lysine--tRNA ligase [Aciditerrimonas ferrireducens]|uniref:lysine--tRNA ligase n=1 Tax=Aciditerrimonas ferrireducens TaxID=667306 RepID=UPI0028A13B86|nr:lysine--tRNA ligase [Aciditerrimonas ferrireducens]
MARQDERPWPIPPRRQRRRLAPGPSTGAPGEETDTDVGVAGRLRLVRPQGRLAFATLDDPSGQVQLFARDGVTADFEQFGKLAIGDWVGARGRVVKTRRGELSVLVERWELLALARRGFGDKWRGVSDTETLLRHRELDLWVGDRTREVLVLRSQVLAALRRALWDRGFLEVETPVLHPIPGGATARPFVTHHRALDLDLYLRIAPELYLKRLVVGGLERVFELGRVFRNEGISPRHNPEFTMLELYLAYADYQDLLGLTEQLVAEVTRAVLGRTTLEVHGRTLDLAPPWRRATMAELVSEALGRPLDVHSPRPVLEEAARGLGLVPEPSWGPGKLLLELYEKAVEPTIVGPLAVLDHPVEVSPLARRHREDPELTERFEVVVAGRELANGFSELTDPEDQRARFEAQARAREAGDEEAMVVDEDYLWALELGLPPTAGLGLGVDRFVMLLADASHIREVIAFPTLRPEAPGA